MTKPNPDAADWQVLGGAIRERRLARSLTLVDLAGQVGLSQPFLSQVENGRARPSLVSLHRIAAALDSTPQALFGGALDSATGPKVVRADEASVVDVGSDPAESACRLLLAGDAPFHLLEFDGLPAEPIEYFAHDGFEATYVISGRVEADIDGQIIDLGPRDSVSYPARLPHRLRSVGRRRANVLIIETGADAVQSRGPGTHALAAAASLPITVEVES